MVDDSSRVTTAVYAKVSPSSGNPSPKLTRHPNLCSEMLQTRSLYQLYLKRNRGEISSSSHQTFVAKAHELCSSKCYWRDGAPPKTSTETELEDALEEVESLKKLVVDLRQRLEFFETAISSPSLSVYQYADEEVVHNFYDTNLQVANERFENINHSYHFPNNNFNPHPMLPLDHNLDSNDPRTLSTYPIDPTFPVYASTQCETWSYSVGTDHTIQHMEPLKFVPQEYLRHHNYQYS